MVGTPLSVSPLVPLIGSAIAGTAAVVVLVIVESFNLG